MSYRPSFVKNKFNLDIPLTIIFILLLTLSLTAISLASPLVNLKQNLFLKQVLWYSTGSIILALLIYLDRDNLYNVMKYVYWFLMFALSLLVLDRFISVPFVHIINGARAWFVFPGIGNFQPSEFMKVTLILMSAETIENHNQEKTEISFQSDIQLFLKIFKLVIPPLVLIVLQPDTGIPLIIVISIIAMVAISGIKSFWIYAGLTLASILFFGFIYIFFFHQQVLINAFGASYRLSRFYGWLETEKYILTYGNQLYEGLLAIGSAGLFGHPLKEAVVYFAEPQNDFIFAVIGQNFGFIGTSFTILLSLALDVKLLSIAFKHDSQRDKLMVVGLLGMLVFQQVENMGMISGLLPITGITLPFISYGGSSLWSYMIPLSIVFRMASDNISKKGSYI